MASQPTAKLKPIVILSLIGGVASLYFLFFRVDSPFSFYESASVNEVTAKDPYAVRTLPGGYLPENGCVTKDECLKLGDACTKVVVCSSEVPPPEPQPSDWSVYRRSPTPTPLSTTSPNCTCPPGPEGGRTMCKLPAECYTRATPTPSATPNCTCPEGAMCKLSSECYPQASTTPTCNSQVNIFALSRACSSSGYSEFTVVCSTGLKQVVSEGTCYDSLSAYKIAKTICNKQCLSVSPRMGGPETMMAK